MKGHGSNPEGPRVKPEGPRVKPGLLTGSTIPPAENNHLSSSKPAIPTAGIFLSVKKMGSPIKGFRQVEILGQSPPLNGAEPQNAAY